MPPFFTRHRETVALVVLLIAPGFMSSAMAVARVAAEHQLPPTAVSFGRWFVMGLVLLPFTGRNAWRHRSAISANWPRLLALGFIGMGMSGVTMYVAAQTTTVTNIALLGTGAPILIVLGAVLFLRERIVARQVLGIVLSLAGVVAIVAKGDVRVLLHLDLVPGDLWTLAGCFCWATYSLMLRAHGLVLPALTLMCVTALMGSLALLPLAVWEWWRLAPHVDWAAMFQVVVYTALVPGLIGYRLHAHATSVLGAGRSAVVNYIAPVYASFYGWLLFDERLLSHHLVGGALVFGGVWLASRGRPDIAKGGD